MCTKNTKRCKSSLNSSIFRRSISGRNEKFKARDDTSERRGETDSICSLGYWAIFGNGRRELRNCGVHCWFKLLRAHPEHLDREELKPNASVALHRHSHSVVAILPPESDSTIQLMTTKPDVTYQDIGGNDIQKQEVREAVELPLTQFELYKQIGIDPPRGVLMYGPPGTGKTMMAKAVANATTAAFISVVGSEFVQKYLGEGPVVQMFSSCARKCSCHYLHR